MEYENDLDPDARFECHDCDYWQQMIDDVNRQLAELRSAKQTFAPPSERETKLETWMKSLVQSQMQHQREVHGN